MPQSDDVQLEIVPDAAAMSRRVADVVSATVAAKPDAVLAVPTGSTPLGLFSELVDRIRRGRLDLGRAHVFCLDEYLGVAPNDPNSLTGWLQRSFLDPAGIAPERVHAIPATDPDPERAARRYEEELNALGGLDLAVLGLGPNGHVAYNEPGSAADSRTRPLDLTVESIEQASAYWDGTVPIPSRAMTIGIGTLLESRRIVLMVTGDGKAGILRRALSEPMGADVPASWLRLAGDRLVVVADEAAASRLP